MTKSKPHADCVRRLDAACDLAILLAEEIRDKERAEPAMADRKAASRAAELLGVPDITGPRQQEILAAEFARLETALSLTPSAGSSERAVLGEGE